MKFKGIENLIFDLDGTLIDSSRGVVEATNYSLRSLGEPLRDEEEIKRFIGYPLEEMFRAFSDKPFAELWKYFVVRSKEVMAGSARPLDGADQILHELHRRGYKLGIGTTKIKIHVEKILDKFGWQELIDSYAGADDVSSVKPNPEVFIKLMALMGAGLNNTVVIGDTANDVYAAKGASLPVIAVRSPYGRNDELEKSRPDIIINNLKDVLENLL